MITWDDTDEKLYEFGIDHGVLFVANDAGTSYAAGVPWNGLTSVTESAEGGEADKLYADDIVYANRRSLETAKGTIEAYTYPDEFEVCDGSIAIATGTYLSQQKRRKFGLSYRTKIGNDTDGDGHGYKIHIIWNARADASDRQYSTVNESSDAVTFSWDFTADGVKTEGYRDIARITLDSTKVDPAKLARVERILYGTASTPSRLPTPLEIMQIFQFEEEAVLDSSEEDVADSDSASVIGRTANF